MARAGVLKLCAALACAALVADCGVAVWGEAVASGLSGPAAGAESRSLREEGKPDVSCDAIIAAGRDQLTFEEAQHCVAECAAHVAVWGWYQKRVIVAGAIVVVVVGLVSWWRRHAFYGIAFAAMAMVLMDHVDDFTGILFAGHGTICLKSLTCVIFNRVPPWSGYAIGSMLAAYSASQAFAVPLDLEALHEYIASPPSEEAKAAPATILCCIPASKGSSNLFDLMKKASLCFGDIIVDCSAIAGYLRRGQPLYASCNAACVCIAEKMAEVEQKYYKTLTPPAHALAVSQMHGPQADFMFYFKESLSIGMPSPAFLFRASREFIHESAWSSYIAFSALFSSDCNFWYPLGQMCAQVLLGCVSALDFAEIYELACAEASLLYNVDDGQLAFRAIPRGHYTARRMFSVERRMDLMRAYCLCQYLSKGVVSTALIHRVTPVGLYATGMFLSLAFVPVRLRSGLRYGGYETLARDVFIWPIVYLMMTNYCLTLPRCDFYDKKIVNTVQHPLSLPFVSVLWVLLLAHGAVTGWPAAMTAAAEGTFASAWGGVVCEEALLQNDAAGHGHPHGRSEAAASCVFGLSPVDAQRVVRVLLLLLGLAAHLGYVAIYLRLRALGDEWWREDGLQLQRTRRMPDDERILFEPGDGKLLPCDKGGGGDREWLQEGAGSDGEWLRRASVATSARSDDAVAMSLPGSDNESEPGLRPLLQL